MVKISHIQSKLNTAREKFDKLFMNVRKSFWVGIAILVILLVLSIVVLSVIIAQYAKADDYVVSLKTNLYQTFDVFSLEYENDSGEITVQGLDGNKVIAPGTSVDYTIKIKNADTRALDYELSPLMEFISEHKLPVVVRILDNDFNYIVGDAKTWAPIEELNDFVHRGTIPRGQSVEYTFQWKWPFESGNDEYDTFLGGMGVNVGLNLSFALRAAANTNADVNGGFLRTDLGKLVVLLIVAIMLLVALILLVYSILKRKGIIPTPPSAPAPVQIPQPKPTPTPAPIVKEPVKEQRQQGFNGKMAYINIDVLVENFKEGEVITLSILKKKGLLPASAKQMKVLARNGYKLEKALTIETQGISTEARRMVIEAGGRVIITKG